MNWLREWLNPCKHGHDFVLDERNFPFVVVTTYACTRCPCKEIQVRAMYPVEQIGYRNLVEEARQVERLH